MPYWCHVLNARLTAGFIVLAAAVSVPASGAETLDSYQPLLIVRSHAGTEGDMRTAQSFASAIVRGAGIDVQWLDCTLPKSTKVRESCGRPPRWNEVILRTTMAGASEPGQKDVSLGFAAVNVAEGDGKLVTIYADRIAETARRASVDRVKLLGRVIAHEIGHLLLGTNRHGSRGLMRALWSRGDLRRNWATDWLFLESEGAAMRARLAARAYDLPF
jgi:hypothetical protein